MTDKIDNVSSNWKIANEIVRDYGTYRRKLNYVPDGYKTIRGMAIEWKISCGAVKRAIDKIGVIAPRKFRNDQEVINQYYSPTDIDIIYDKMRDLITAKPPPAGWITVNVMARDWGIDDRKIKAAILALNNLQSKKCINGNGNLRNYYSPQAVALIHDSLRDSFSNRKIPPGWKLVWQMANEWGVDSLSITRIVRKLGDLEAMTFSGNTRVYFSPKAVAAIYNELSGFISTPKAPAKWKTTFQMAQEFGVSIHKVRNIVRKLENLEVRKYKNQQGAVRLFYSPKSKQQILKRLEEGNAEK